MSKNIFAKKSERKVCYDKVDIETVRETIPTGSYTDQQILLIDHMIESRWRFLHIPVKYEDNDNKQKIKIKKMVEISKKVPGQDRLYLSKNMDWTKTNIDPLFDNFVVEQYFYYTES